MSVLTETPNTEIFSIVPTLDDVVKEFHDKGVPELIKDVGKLFVKYDAYDHFGLSMVHRHFDMTRREILVETIKDDRSLSIAIPWNFEGSSAAPADPSMWKSYKLSGKKFILPQNWCFSPSGVLIPFEYLATDDEQSLPKPNEDFTRELYAILKTLDAENVVGLRAIANLQGTKSWETTPEGIRANVVVFGEQPQELKGKTMVRVLWTFDSDGKFRFGEAWCGFCTYCNHCNHCGTCHQL